MSSPWDPTPRSHTWLFRSWCVLDFNSLKIKFQWLMWSGWGYVTKPRWHRLCLRCLLRDTEDAVSEVPACQVQRPAFRTSKHIETLNYLNELTRSAAAWWALSKAQRTWKTCPDPRSEGLVPGSLRFTVLQWFQNLQQCPLAGLP
jgi:hypothetical protein